MKTKDEQKSILDEEVFRLVQQGWYVKNRTETTCELAKTTSRGLPILDLPILFMGEEIS